MTYKSLPVVFLFAAILAACGNAETPTTQAAAKADASTPAMNPPSTMINQNDTPPAALAIKMPEQARVNGCAGCHAIERKGFGPAWMEVSKFYNGKTEKTATGKTLQEAVAGKSTEDFLLEKISKGGKGNWGSVPMMANDPEGQKQAEIKHLVKSILDLAK